MIPCPECDGEGITGTCRREVCGTCGGKGSLTPAEWQAWLAALQDDIEGEDTDGTDP